MGNSAKSGSKSTSHKSNKEKSANTARSNTKKEVKAKSKPLKPANPSQKTALKPARRRPGKPYNLKVIYPRQKEIRAAIFSGMGASMVFRDHLIKAKLFEQDGDKIFLVLPVPRKRNQPGTYCENPVELLDELAFTLRIFFVHQHNTKGYVVNFKYEDKLTRALATIAGSREIFLDAGVSANSFDLTIKRMHFWLFDRVLEHRIDKTKPTVLADLMEMLLTTYKRMTKLSERQIFLFIARLFKYLGFAAGMEIEISNRLRFKYFSKKRQSELL